MKYPLAVAALSVFLAMTGGALADDAQTQIEAARAAYARGDGLRTLSSLQNAAQVIGTRLSEQLGRALPAPLRGWETAAPEFQALDQIGGGVSMTRGYTRDPSTLNATIVIDNPAVANSLPLFDTKAPQRPGWSRLRIGTDDAVLRYDQQGALGEILMLIDGRALLQIEGTEIGSADVLIEAAKGWNVGLIRKLLVN